LTWNHFTPIIRLILKLHNLLAAQESGKIIEVQCGILCSNFLKREIIFFTTTPIENIARKSPNLTKISQYYREYSIYDNIAKFSQYYSEILAIFFNRDISQFNSEISQYYSKILANFLTGISQ
jgi:hypothetical protein